MCQYRCALDLGQYRYTTRLQFDVPVMSVTSFYDAPIANECCHECTRIHVCENFVDFRVGEHRARISAFGIRLALRVSPAVTRLTVYRWLQIEQGIVEQVLYCRRVIPVRIVLAQKRIGNDS